MSFNALKNLPAIAATSFREAPNFGRLLFETLSGITGQIANLAQQTNANLTGQPQSPPQVNALKVQASNGHFTGAITDNNAIFRDIHYYVEHADNPHFTNPQIVHLGHSRNFHFYFGNATRYFRAYSAYGSSAPGPAAYHGSSSTPLAVTGGGGPAPVFLASQGSGTGAAGVGLSGPGPIPFRSVDGVPPPR